MKLSAKVEEGLYIAMQAFPCKIRKTRPEPSRAAVEKNTADV